MNLRKNLDVFVPLLFSLAVSIPLGFTVWTAFFWIGPWVGGSMSLGSAISKRGGPEALDLGRRLSLILLVPLFLVFFGFMQRENMQIEETVFYTAYFLSTAVFTRCLIHFAVAKVVGPLIWGRGFCGWVCWIAAVLEWLPIKENKPIPKRLTYIRISVLIVSLGIPLALIFGGYDYLNKHIYGDFGQVIQTNKFDQLIFFIVSTSVYYAAGIVLAFVFRKKRAFCKIACPVSLVMKAQTRIALIRYSKPSGAACTDCGACSRSCPMDVDVASYIRRGKAVTSTECVACGICRTVCPQGAIA